MATHPYNIDVHNEHNKWGQDLYGRMHTLGYQYPEKGNKASVSWAAPLLVERKAIPPYTSLSEAKQFIKSWLNGSGDPGTVVDIFPPHGSDSLVPNFDDLPTPKPGTPRAPGREYNDRVLVANPKERKERREAKVYAIISRKWNAEKYRIEDVREGKQKGCDWLIWSIETGKLIAMIDAKPSPGCSRKQWRAAMNARRKGVEYWIVGETWKMVVTPDLKRTPTYWKLSLPKAA